MSKDQLLFFSHFSFAGKMTKDEIKTVKEIRKKVEKRKQEALKRSNDAMKLAEVFSK